MDICQMLLQEINKIKAQLNALYEIKKELTDYEILNMSQHLDELILKYQNKCNCYLKY